MTQPSENLTSRRSFIKTTGQIAAVSALAGVKLPFIHAQSDDTISLALIGCGGRGSGATVNALNTTKGPVKLVAMADVFEHRLAGSYKSLKENFAEKVDVADDRKFIGFDAYKQAIDVLKPGDVALFTTPPAFRWVHFKYAIEKGVNVFMEKPVTVDGPSSRKMLQLSEEADKKGLKVGVGLMCRHCDARQQLHDRVVNGEIGDIIAMRAYRMHGPVGFAFSKPKPEGITETMYQVQRFHSFLWASGGLYSDFYIHNIDETCWMKDKWPVKAHATGGRHFREDYVDQNFDQYSVEYTFDDGTKLFLDGRTMNGCHDEFASYAHGTKGMAIVSTASHSPAKCRLFKGQNVSRQDMIWAYPQPEPDPYLLEWEHLMDAIRNGKKYNEVPRGVAASVVTSMGRMAAHTGQVITYDQMLNCEHEFAPDVDKLTPDGPAPLRAGPDGKYPVPMPGVLKDREYDSAVA
ncbi:MAG: Gfo/Idh/MocA family oxidoreductase [Verrucomicrobiota bacterium]|nr:Gfo/Idh/MocA family oxidoreductase [Verrucomicrobiota bacterium]